MCVCVYKGYIYVYSLHDNGAGFQLALTIIITTLSCLSPL